MAISNLPKLNFSVPFAMTAALPVEYNAYFSTLADAQAAAAKADVPGSTTTVYYYGQKIVVVGATEAKLYIIQPDKTLKEAGGVPLGDGASITVSEDGKIAIKGVAEATANQQPRIKVVDGVKTIEWYTPDTSTVEGLQQTVAGHTTKIGELETGLGTANTNIQTNANDIDSLQADMSKAKTDLTGLQTVVDSKADKTDLAKTNLYLDALYKLNKGQTYDVLEQESEAYSVDVPSGAKYVGIDKVGGHSEVIDGEIVSSQTDRVDAVGFNQWDEEWEVGAYNSFGEKMNGVATIRSKNPIPVIPNTSYFFNAPYSTRNGINYHDENGVFISLKWINAKSAFITPSNCRFISFDQQTDYGTTYKNDICINLSNPSRNGEYEPYSLQQIETGFPILKSAGSVYDYIDLNEGKLYTWTYIDGNEIKALTEPVITDITIPTELTDWLTVEAGGSITFHNTDEGKRLLIPSKLSFVRKLDEVTV